MKRARTERRMIVGTMVGAGCCYVVCLALLTIFIDLWDVAAYPADRWKQEVALRRDYPQHQGCASIFHLTPGPPVASLQLLNAREASNGKSLDLSIY